MTGRLSIITVMLTLGAAGLGWISRPEARVARQPLHDLPYAIGEWAGRDAREFDAKTLEVLGVDDYITRSYAAPNSVPMSLYIGYYESQRTGDTMHSPMRCLPGTGWQPLTTSIQQVVVEAASGHARAVPINRYLVQKGLQRHVVLFWYQMHGRVLSSEYTTKFFLIRDAVQLNRTDGALLRVIAPIPDGEPEAVADSAATGFVQALFPLLARHLPE